MRTLICIHAYMKPHFFPQMNKSILVPKKRTLTDFLVLGFPKSPLLFRWVKHHFIQTKEHSLWLGSIFGATDSKETFLEASETCKDSKFLSFPIFCVVVAPAPVQYNTTRVIGSFTEQFISKKRPNNWLKLHSLYSSMYLLTVSKDRFRKGANSLYLTAAHRGKCRGLSFNSPRSPSSANLDSNDEEDGWDSRSWFDFS